MSSQKCPNCGLVNFADTTACKRCRQEMSSENNCASPEEDICTKEFGPWYNGSLLVMDKNEPLPDRCVQCNATSTYKLKRGLVWHPPIYYLLFLAGVLPYAIAAWMVAENAVVHLGLCNEHRNNRRLALALGSAAVVLGAVLLVLGLSNNQYLLSSFAIILMTAGIGLAGKFYGVVRATEIDDRLVWLKGVHREYLESLSLGPR